MRSLLPYASSFSPAARAIVLPTALAMRGPDGSFDPTNLTAHLDAMPRWQQGELIAMHSI
jgi:hypothetical protein